MFTSQIIDFTNSTKIILSFIVLGVIIYMRYALVCLIFELIFNRLLWPKFRKRKINTKLTYKPKQKAMENLWSLATSFIFSGFFVLLLYCWQHGWTQLYSGFHWFDIVYIPLSVFIYLFAQDTYYYWLHRWMHHPKAYKIIHKVHHHSVVTSPWTSFSFHPYESILQAITLPILVFIIPLHWIALFLLLLIMTMTAVINHLDIEIYPKGFATHWLGKYLIGATHHSLHHAKFLTNYGLYFTVWDHWMKTESPQYQQAIQELSTS